MNWHARFVQQAAWTRDLRSYLFEHTGIELAKRVLEVGCGTGAILSELTTQAAVHGLDLEPGRLVEAGVHAPGAALVCGDALWLPYPAGIFDVTFCHFLLLWVSDPLQALGEMARVTHPGGHVLALAEPDYETRVDKPDVLAPLGRWQTESLRRQGADPGLGARLADLFRQAGIPLIETGTLRGSPGSGISSGISYGMGRGGEEPLPASGERGLEWAVLEADLAGIVPVQEIQRMKLLDEQAWERGERVLSVPTYFAWGQVKADGIIPRGGSLV
jgi:SAM-dependent methyltransferase